MELIQVDEINKKFLFYTDSRSSIAWLKKKNISIIKLGKKYFISKQDFNNAIEGLILKNNNQSAPNLKTKEYLPTSTEHDFLNRLLLTSIQEPR